MSEQPAAGAQRAGGETVSRPTIASECSAERLRKQRVETAFTQAGRSFLAVTSLESHGGLVFFGRAPGEPEGCTGPHTHG